MDSTIDLSDASSALDLSNIRFQLIRLEDTIIFYLIERAQFPHNPSIYLPTSPVHIPDFSGSFLDWMLLQQERMYAQVRRYQAPDEYAFFPDQLPEPFLAPLTYPNLLHPNDININPRIKDAYINHIIPEICPNQEDRGEERENYGSSATVDVLCLQSLSRRIHFGKFVAEAKFRAEPERFGKMIREKDVKGLEDAITKKDVEMQVLKRLELKAKTYGTDPSAVGPESPQVKINVDAVVNMYRDWVIPMTKDVEIDYLLQRLDEPTEKK